MSHEIGLSTFPPEYNNGALDEPRQPLPPQQVPTNTAQMESPNQVEQASTNNTSQHDPVRKKWFDDMRGWIMVVAVLVASVTYTTGLNPPGGFWQDDNGHEAGASILHDKHPDRYKTFFYANATAFMASLVIIILLMNEKFYRDRSKVIMLNISMVLGIVSLIISYAAGCARRFSTSIYVIALAVVVLLFVISTAHILPSICHFVKGCAPCLPNVLGRGIFSPQNSLEKTREDQQNRSQNSNI